MTFLFFSPLETKDESVDCKRIEWMSMYFDIHFMKRKIMETCDENYYN